ncbi:MAG: CDP-alcohol phosphatidyltransferase family protein [Chloroflexota bacterium]|jgi:CDP-diacylglycerol--glycerol-3-phosphate 3-phosphatidyltransferase
MFDKLYPLARRISFYPARLLVRLGVSPNSITLLGLLLNFLVAAVLASGQLVVGGVLVLLINAFDMLDGSVARLSGRVTRFGAMLDSTLDRYSEGIVFLGLMVWLFNQGNWAALLAAYIALFGSVMVSYSRARAEGLGLHGEVGLVPRPERIVLLALGLFFPQYLLLPILWLLAVLTNVTVAQRVLHVKRQLDAQEKAAE